VHDLCIDTDFLHNVCPSKSMRTTYDHPKGKGRVALRSVFRTQMADEADLRSKLFMRTGS